MKKQLLHLTISAFLITALSACEEENLISGSTKSTNGTTTPVATTPVTTPTGTKCYVKDVLEVVGSDTYKSVYTFNAKNLLEKVDNDGAINTYGYDANGRITTVTVVDGAATEVFTYVYDTKGVMTNVKYTAKNTPFEVFIKDYTFTSNAAGQVTKVIAATKDGNLEFTLEYDAKSNLKKIIVLAGGMKETLFENLTFDDKPNVYTNAGLGKVNIPFLLIGAFFGENLSHYMNTNNVLTDSRISAFSDDPVKAVYTYTYTKEGQPSKMSYVETTGKEKVTGSSTYSYTCK